MAFITTISDTRSIQIGGTEELIRPIGLTDWTKIRIGVRCRFQARATFGGQLMLIGLCRGPNGYLSNATVDWLGTSIGVYAVNNSWVYNVSAPYAYISAPNSASNWNKVGTTITLVNSGVGGGVPILTAAGSPAGFYSHFCLEITRGSPTYSLQLFGMSAASVLTNVTKTAFYSMLETDTLTLGSFSNIPAFTYSGQGIFDRFSFFWSSAVAPLEISDIAIARYL